MRSGWKSSSASSFSPDADQLDRGAGDRAHGQRRAAAGIAIHPGHHDAGDADLVVEGAGGVDRVLAGHRIDHQQGLVRAGRGRTAATSAISASSIDEPAGGVEDDHVEHLAPADIHGARAISSGVWPATIGRLATPACSASFSQLQLRRRALGVERASSTFFLSRSVKPQRDLARGRGLAGALQADHQDRHRRRRVEVERHRRLPPPSASTSSR